MDDQTHVCIFPGINLEKEVKRVSEKFNLKLDSGEDVSVDFNFLFGLVIKMTLPEMKRGTWEYAIKSQVCVLLPHMKTAVIRDKKFYRISKARKKLKELDYVCVQRTLPSLKDNDSEEWLSRTEESILLAIRAKNHPGKKSVDPRIIRIVYELSSQTSLQSLTFGTFWPGVENDYGGGDIFHDNSPVLQFYRIKPRKVERELEMICTGLSPSIAIGLTSKVLRRNEEMHIPMIDFETRDLEVARSIVKKQNMRGTIIASGNSYHFYGFNFLNHQENVNFLDSLKDLKGVDNGWVNYQLKRGYSNLRVTPALDKFSQPCFIEKIFP